MDGRNLAKGKAELTPVEVGFGSNTVHLTVIMVKFLRAYVGQLPTDAHTTQRLAKFEFLIINNILFVQPFLGPTLEVI